MNRNVITYLVAIIGCLLSVSCSWVKDDLDDCPTGVWLQLEYTYNMLDVDAASNHIDEACVMVYDTAGNFLEQIRVDHTQLLANDYRIDISGLPEGDYRFVVWGGLNDSRFMANGAQSYQDFLLSVATDSRQTTSDNLGDLYYGCQDSIHVDYKYAVHRVSMMKDTNRLVCLVESEAETSDINTNVYTMELVADNAKMDATNSPVFGSKTYYDPYSAEDVTIDDPDLGQRQAARFGICTMRLLENDNARLVLKLKDTDYEVFNIPVTEYLAQVAALTELNGRQLSTQEYLDRQDQFTFIFCLSAQGDALIRCKVNNWVLRVKENILL